MGLTSYSIVITFLVVLISHTTLAAPTKYTVDFTNAPGCSASNDCKTVTEAIAAAVSGDLIIVRHNALAYVVGTQTINAHNLQFIGEDAGPNKAALTMQLVGGADSGKWVFSNFAITNNADVPFIELKDTTGDPTIYLFDVDLDNFASSNQVIINTSGSTTTGSPTVILAFGTITTHKVIEQNDDTGNVDTSIVNCQISGIDQKKSFLFEGPVTGTFSFKNNVVTATSTDAPDDMYLTKTSTGSIKHFFSGNHFDFDAIPLISHEIWEFETTGDADAFLSFYNNNMDMNIAFFAVKWQVTTSGTFYYVGEENTWDFNDANGAEEVFPINNNSGTQVIYVRGSRFIGRDSATTDDVPQIEIQSNGAAGYICLYLQEVIFFPTAVTAEKGLDVTGVNGDVEVKLVSNTWGSSNNRVGLNYAAGEYVGDTTRNVQNNMLDDNIDLSAPKIEAASGSVIAAFDAKCNGGGANPTVTLPRYRMPQAVDDSGSTYNGIPIQIDVDNNDTPDATNEAFTVVTGSLFSTRGFVTEENAGNIQFSNSAGLGLTTAGTDTFFYVLTDVTGGFDVAKVTVTVVPPFLTLTVSTDMRMYIPTRFTWVHNLNSAHKVTFKLFETDRATAVTGQTWISNKDINPAEAFHAVSRVLPKEFVLKAETTGPTGNLEWWSNNFFVSVCTTMNPTRTETCYHI